MDVLEARAGAAALRGIQGCSYSGVMGPILAGKIVREGFFYASFPLIKSARESAYKLYGRVRGSPGDLEK